MSLSFKTISLYSSAASVLTKEQIDAVLYPVTIVLTEEAVLAEDNGPVMESTTETTGSGVVVVGAEVYVSDDVPPVDEDTTASFGPWGVITVGELQKEILDSFREGTYANPEVGGGKLAFEIQGSGIGGGDFFGGDDTGGNNEVPNDNAPV